MTRRPKRGSIVSCVLYQGAAQPGDLYTSVPAGVVTEIDRIESIGQLADQRGRQQRTRLTRSAANVGERRREKWLRVGDVAVGHDRQPLLDVARHDEHRDHRFLVSLAEQHGIRVVGENDCQVLERPE